MLLRRRMVQMVAMGGVLDVVGMVAMMDRVVPVAPRGGGAGQQDEAGEEQGDSVERAHGRLDRLANGWSPDETA